MTTLAWDNENKRLMADSRTSNRRVMSKEDTTNKIVVIPRGNYLPWEKPKDNKVAVERITALMGCGTVAMIDLLIKGLIENGKSFIKKFDVIKEIGIGDTSASATVVVATTEGIHVVKMNDQSGRLRSFIKYQNLYDAKHPGHKQAHFWGSGSGPAEFTSNRLKLGPIAGMLAARMVDNGSGGVINVYQRGSDGFFDLLVRVEDQGAREDFLQFQKMVAGIDPTIFSKKHDRPHIRNDINLAIKARTQKEKPRARYDWETSTYKRREK